MKIIKNKTSLENEITSIDVEESIAVCFILGALDVQSIIAIRNAERICDKVIAVNLSKNNLNKVQCSLINRAGANYLFESEDDINIFNCKLEAGVRGVNSTLILQVLITVMPLVVTVPENNIHLIKIIKNIQQTFGEFFTLHIKVTPVDLLTVAHKKLRQALTPVMLDIENGENDVETLKETCNILLTKLGFELNYITFIDTSSLDEHISIVAPDDLLLVEASLNGQKVRDILSIREK